MFRINVGSNNVKSDDAVNLDGLDLENVDGVAELNVSPYVIKIKESNRERFQNHIKPYHASEGETDLFVLNYDCADEVVAIEFLEHISFRETQTVLGEWYRVLRKGGRVALQVPDCGKMMEHYVRGEICDCVPHKGDLSVIHADSNCFVCSGKAKVNPLRWLYSFTGAQKHKYDAHLNIFTKQRMEEALVKAGFREIEFEEHPFKIKVKALK